MKRYYFANKNDKNALVYVDIGPTQNVHGKKKLDGWAYYETIINGHVKDRVYMSKRHEDFYEAQT